MHAITDYPSSIAPPVGEPVSAAPTRRHLLTLLGVGTLSAGLAALAGPDAVDGKKKRRKGKRKGKRGGKRGKGGQGNNTANGSNNGNTPPPPPPPPPPPASVEEQLLDLINAYRQGKGKGALVWDDRLGTAAQNHSDDMTANGFSSHTGSNGSSPRDRIVATGYPANGFWGENIFESAPNDPSAQTAFTWWKNSPGHNANMLGENFTRIGLGQATNSAGVTRWTAVFASEPS
jgi:uncharacterized protein YkwD